MEDEFLTVKGESGITQGEGGIQPRKEESAGCGVEPTGTWGQTGIVNPYPKPKDAGGRLIRELIASLKREKIPLPITSHILCATSGGSDSVALAVCLARYGRRVIDPKRITLFHVNHGWRAEASDGDEAFVRALASKLGVGFLSVTAREQPAAGDSWEEHARRLRKEAYLQAAKKLKCRFIFTAHTGDDLAETRLWRLFTGKWETHAEGIYARHGKEFRPFLKLRKAFLQEFLNEEAQGWREDQTNHEGRFLRSRMRNELFPVIEKLFPRAVTHLIDLEPKKRTRSSVRPVSKKRRIK